MNGRTHLFFQYLLQAYPATARKCESKAAHMSTVPPRIPMYLDFPISLCVPRTPEKTKFYFGYISPVGTNILHHLATQRTPHHTYVSLIPRTPSSPYPTVNTGTPSAAGPSAYMG